jgi:V-type H+-transporting ATPase subunit E
MEEEDVKSQLEHMVKFIYREAEEKAQEITAKAQEEFSMEKQNIVTEEKMKIAKEFERKEKQIETSKRIAYSNQLNQMRLKILKARDDGVRRLVEEAQKKLGTLTQDKQAYKILLRDLITQSLVRLDETDVVVLIREEDKALAESVLQESIAQFKKLTGKKDVKVVLDTENFLPPSREHSGADGEFCSGGVILTGNNGKIICNNTLDVRLSMAVEGLLPKIRETVFGRSATRKHYD